MPFEESTNVQAFMKVGMYGPEGSGKTFTAMKWAIGIVEYLKAHKLPCHNTIRFIDTEAGSSFVAPIAQERGIKVEVDRTRALKVVIEDIQASIGNTDVLVIDSLTHIWQQFLEDYLGLKNRKAMQFQDWAYVKPEWRKFSTLFLNSAIHLFALGRMGTIYEMRKNEVTGKDELVAVDTKFKAESEFGYEPSLSAEFERVKHDGGIINRVTFIKDRCDILNGKSFDFPTFDTILPVFKRLNLGGVHIGVKTDDTSASLWAEDNDKAEAWATRRRASQFDEAMNFLQQCYPGSSADAKEARLDIIEIGTGHRTSVWLESTAKNVEVEDFYRRVKSFRELVVAAGEAPRTTEERRALWGKAVQKSVDDVAVGDPLLGSETKDKPPTDLYMDLLQRIEDAPDKPALAAVAKEHEKAALTNKITPDEDRALKAAGAKRKAEMSKAAK